MNFFLQKQFLHIPTPVYTPHIFELQLKSFQRRNGFWFFFNPCAQQLCYLRQTTSGQQVCAHLVLKKPPVSNVESPASMTNGTVLAQQLWLSKGVYRISESCAGIGRGVTCVDSKSFVKQRNHCENRRKAGREFSVKSVLFI